MGWNIQTVDSTGNVGYETSLALDAGGSPHISYFDNTNQDLKYAVWNGSSWNIETVDSEGTVGRQSSLALDSSGYPHIGYSAARDWPYANLKYAAWNGSTWDVQTLKRRGNCCDVSLALDSSNAPHIAYYRSWPGGNDVMYIHWNGSSWIEHMVDDGWQGARGLSLALDSSDNPHISYYDHDHQRLRYAWRNGSSWSSTLLDTTTSGANYDTSLALDSGGYPHISYSGGMTPHLKYAAWDGSSWNIETVDETKVSSDISLALDSSGFPHFVYYDDTNQDLNYAAWDGLGWAIETVDSTGDVGKCVSLALDGAGNRHISYYDATNGDLKYAFRRTVIDVLIDIKPGSEPNSINLGAHGVVPVAILTTPDFDAAWVDELSLTLSGAPVRVKGKSRQAGAMEDVNGDGYLDLVVHFYIGQLHLDEGATEAVLEGFTLDGIPIIGFDWINVVP